MTIYQILVYGKVQGVGFRYSTIQLLKKLNLKGGAKNLANGSVYIEVLANEQSFRSFIEKLQSKTFNSFACIDNIEYKSTSKDVFQNDFDYHN